LQTGQSRRSSRSARAVAVGLASADVVYGSRKFGLLRRGAAVETATALIAGQLLRQAELVERVGSIAGELAHVAEQVEGLLAAGGCGPVVVGQPMHRGELGENLRLLVAVAEVTAERQGLPQGGGGRVVSGQPLHAAQVHEGVGLAGPVAGLVGRGQRRVVPHKRVVGTQVGESMSCCSMSSYQSVVSPSMIRRAAPT
jgi:hypothetical protein